MTRAVFAIPGDKDQRTGGYIYDATVLRRLNALGHDTAHVQLPDSFPDPSSMDMQKTFDALAAIPRSCPTIVDGLALGALDPAGLCRVAAPIVGMVHHPLGLESGLPADRARRLLDNEAEVLRHVAHVIVPSQHIADTVERELGVERDRLTVAPPGFEQLDEDPRPVPAKAMPPLILSVGLLTPRKGHDVLLKSLAQLTDLDWQAEIVGKAHEPETAEKLRAEAAALGLSDRVRFAGEVSEEALRHAYGRASVFALATRYEGYGMVLSEAMQNGLPVVSTRVGAVPETVGEAALLVEPDEPLALAEAIRTLLTSPETARSYARAARDRAASLPGWTHTARVFADVLERIGS